VGSTIRVNDRPDCTDCDRINGGIQHRVHQVGVVNRPGFPRQTRASLNIASRTPQETGHLHGCACAVCTWQGGSHRHLRRQRTVPAGSGQPAVQGRPLQPALGVGLHVRVDLATHCPIRIPIKIGIKNTLMGHIADCLCDAFCSASTLTSNWLYANGSCLKPRPVRIFLLWAPDWGIPGTCRKVV
jgi:hypothetical protein